MPAIRALVQQRLTFGGGDDAEKPPLRLERSLRLLAVAFAGDPARVDDLTALTEIAADPGSASDARADIGHSSPFAFVLHSAKFLGESDEKPFRSTDVAEPIRVFILDYFAYELRAKRAKPFKRVVDVVHGEHDAEVA
jgi:hypothetical protein